MGKTRISEVRVDDRPERLYMGIRTQTPFKGMFKVVASLAKEMDGWLERQGVAAAGPHFLRYHAIDMAGEMDISYGIPVKEAVSGDGRVTVDSLPGGHYASLVYRGHGLAGNKALLAWATRNSVAWDRWEAAKGDAFRSRYEAYLTDPEVEPRKSKWEIEVAIELADDARVELL